VVEHLGTDYVIWASDYPHLATLTNNTIQPTGDLPPFDRLIVATSLQQKALELGGRLQTARESANSLEIVRGIVWGIQRGSEGSRGEQS
jgi:hypothetical protein